MPEDKRLERYILVGLAIAAVWFVVSIIFGCSGFLPTSGNVSIILDDGAGDCFSACANLDRLGCEAGLGSPGADDVFGTDDDVSCSEVCQELTREPTFSLRQKCVSAARSCEAVDECFD